MKNIGLHPFELFEFRPNEGKIYFEDERMLVWSASAFGALQKSLVRRLGVTAARRVLCEFGYQHGFHCCLTSEQALGKARDGSAIATRVHEIVGIGKYENTRATEPPSFRFQSDFIDSVEAEQFAANIGKSDIPVCWWAVAFASGYCSARFGVEAYFKELRCVSQGHDVCEVLGQDAEQWGAEEVEVFRADYGFADAGEALKFREEQYALHRDWHRKRSEERKRYAGFDEFSREQYSSRQRVAEQAKESGFIVREETMWQALDQAARVAKLNTPVLVHGETGTGKEFVVDLIHRLSARAGRPMISINCAALTETLLESELFGHVRGAFTGAVSEKPGLFELADGGTLFLDEIGEMPFSIQAKLLRVLENGEMRRVGSNKMTRVNPRILASTHRDLQTLASRGEFRQDLYFRLNSFVIELPPLRERQESIPAMAQRFMQEVSASFSKPLESISPDAMAKLIAYEWPGNVRELKHAIERAALVARGKVITSVDLPCEITKPPKRADSKGFDWEDCVDLEQGERQVIVNCLAHHSWNRAAAAATLKIDSSTLWRKMRRHNLL